MKLTEHFTLEEFVRNDHGLENEPPEDVVRVLQQFCEKVLEPLRAWCGGPLIITSGYRCPEGTEPAGRRHRVLLPPGDGLPLRRRCEGARAQVFDWLCDDSHLMFDSVILERGNNPAAETDDCIHIQFRVHYPRRIAFVGQTHNRGVYHPVAVIT